MAEEQAPVEQPTPEIVDQEQSQETPVEEVVPAEVEATPPVPEDPDRGDLRIPLQAERRKRQEYEAQLARLNDPQFIFEQAKKLGLAEGEYSPAVDTQSQGIPHPVDVAGQVRYQLEVERAGEKYPDVVGDPVLAQAAWGFIQQGHSPLQAADIVQKSLDKRLSKVTESRVKEQVNAQAVAESAKRSAELTDSGTTGSSESAEVERLTAQAKNWKDPRAQQEAQLELLKMKMRS